MDDYIFLDSSFEYNQTEKYHLSIQVSLDGFSFSVHQAKSGQCIALKAGSIPEAANGKQEELLLTAMLNEKVLNNSFASVSVLWVTPKVSLIPSELFSPSIAESSLKLCHSISREEKIIWNEQSQLQSTWVYSIPTSIWDFLNQQFSNLSIHHLLVPFATKAMQIEASNHPSVYIHAEKNFLNILIPGKEGKHFFNTFGYQNAADLVYFILNVYNQRRLNSEQSKFYFSGEIKEGDKVYSLLRKYISRMEQLPVKKELGLGKPGFPKSHNQFINLLNFY